MRQKSPKQRRAGLLAIVCAVVATAVACCAFALPARAAADEAAVIAHSGEGDQRVNYTSVDDAMSAGYDGATIVMDEDWSVGQFTSQRIDKSYLIPAGKKITIDMNGHTIKNIGEAETLTLGAGAELTLTSSEKVDIKYKGYSTDDGSECDYAVNAGGLVTNTTSYYCGIVVGESAKLTLDGVAVAGCRGSRADDDACKSAYGGVSLYKNSTLNMQNGAVIEHNRSFKYGGGVYAGGTNVTINMSNSSIRNNWADNYGGGIYFYDTGAVLTMNDGASIEGNTAQSGGGIQLTRTAFSITSKDGEAYISNNRATMSNRLEDKFSQSGGGIHVSQHQSTSNNGLIEGITISGNYSAYDGGGIELDQEYITIRKCVIKDNWCKYEGGGIYDCNDGNLLEDCTITGNACSVDSGGNYEGGGVFVWHSYDLRLKGVCVIKGNTRGKDSGNADDVMLRENGGATAKAYIEGNLSKGSTVGVRTGTTGDRRIARNFKHETNDCLFYDMDGYYVSYGSDEGGDAWQRHATVEFAVSIDGKAYGRYRDGASVALAAPATRDDGKLFWRWDTRATTGLYPVGDYISEKGAVSNALAFTMPQNDVNLVPLYTDKVTAVRFQVEAPEAGKALATSGKLWRTDGGASGTDGVPCAVYWYEVDKYGKVSDTSATGVAKANTTYQAYVSAPESAAYGFFYSESMGTKDVTLRLVTASGETVSEDKAADAYTTLSNSLAARTAGYTTGAGEGKETKTGTVKVQMRNEGLLGGGGAAAAAMALDDGGDGDAQSDLGTAEVSYAYGDESDTVTIAAPAKEGYNFCNWEAAGGAEVSDEDTVTLTVSELRDIESLTAVYTPVATALEVKLAAPAAGDALAATCADVEAACTDGETVSFSEGLGVDSFDVTWSPEPEDGKAGYSTSYTALIELCADDGFEDVEKALAGGATVTCNGVDAEAAGFTVVDGKLCLAVSFAKTADLKAVSVEQPADVEVSFEDACAGEWGLPKTVEVKLQNGEVAEGDVAWEAVEGFDAGATAAQVLTAKGAVTHVAYDGELDTDGLDTAVTVTVRVAAPAKQAEDDAAKSETTTVTATKTASKKGTPSTGDVTWGGFAGLLALAVVCLAAARVSLRKNR